MASKRRDDLSAERTTLKYILLALWPPWPLPSQGRPRPFPGSADESSSAETSQGRPQPFPGSADESSSAKTSQGCPRLFPFEWLFMPILFLLAIWLLNVASDTVQTSLQMRYASALREADIVCEQLAAYGSSIADQCALRQQDNDTWESDFPILSGLITLLRNAGILDKEKPPKSAVVKPDYFKPSDLTALMQAAGLVDEDEAAEADAILDLKGTNPATWIAHAWIAPCSVQDKPHSPQPLVVLGENGMGHPTIEAMLMTVCRLGVTADTGGCPSEKGTNSGKKEGGTNSGKKGDAGVCKGHIDSVVSGMVEGKPVQEIVKDVLRAYQVEARYEEHGSDFKYQYPGTVPNDGVYPFRVSPAGMTSNALSPQLYVYGSSTENKVSANGTEWGKNNPAALRDAAFKFSYFLLTSVAQSDAARTVRFAYQALIGPLQRAILLLIIFIGLILMMRLVLTLLALHKGGATTYVFWGPGNRLNLPRDVWQAERESSGAITSQLLDLLPLLGLFGTVYGILNGLPNAASVVVSSGPLGAEAVKQLFEQLGLAFGTTAIALGGVIILQPLWTLLQQVERRVLNRLVS